MGTKPASSIAVLEVLTEDNYEEWSVRVKIYLQAQDLWHSITEKPPRYEINRSAFKEWNKKNIIALHVIQISCGRQKFEEIRNIDSARDAWSTLKRNKSKGPKPSSKTGVSQKRKIKNSNTENSPAQIASDSSTGKNNAEIHDSQRPINSGISFFLSHAQSSNAN